MNKKHLVYFPGHSKKCSHREGPYHCCSYVDARNKLIPFASAAADQALRVSGIAASPSGEQARNDLWTRVFHAEMTRRCAEEGL
jgi:hypothetical protein